MTIVLLMLLTADPSILWARAVNGCIVVHGRDLTSVNVNLSRPSGTLDGKPLVHVPDITADGPGAYGECQVYVDPGSGSELVLTREDGKESKAYLRRGGYAVASTLVLSGPVRITSGTYERLNIEVDSESPALEVDGVGIKLKDCRIVNVGGGPGLQITNATDCLFDRLSITAESQVYAPPQHTAKRNNWIRCRLNGTHPQRGHASNRGMLGEECLIADCQWSDSDRGIIAQQSGPPMYANLVYRCVQRNTGTTIGGSEGILFEAYNGLPYTATVKGTNLNITTPDEIDARSGMFAFDLSGKRWARVVAAFRWGSKGGYSVTLDRDMGVGSGKWFVGNVAVDNSILHFTAISGKLGVHYFGRSVNSVMRFWDCRQIHDVIVEEACPIQVDRKMCGFAWDNIYDRIRTTGETRGVYKTTKYYDGNLSTESQLPWHRYAQ